MRYSPEHKAQTRQRIIDTAAQLFRRDGIDATGLQPLMKTLGLTPGGFYAHFKSKNELVETALQRAVEQRQARTQEDVTSEQPLAELIAHYLSSAHRANPETGCPLPTISAELGQRGHPSATTDRFILDRLDMIESKLDSEDAAEQSVLLLSSMVGALLLSRSTNDPQLSDRLLKATRKLLIEHVEAQPGA
ncbi:TetR/AcrR family transcriptional regulator [Pseudomonas sp. 2FG]|uniref:TetR/AcrR family transcriptional regulator n=1 Tax=Pseudomonas sp. 2FG TaxID=2502191 RepID=UPI0010F6F33F|nr:TetR/AcrR family transcriptional regulator [Pseudomonas sp. 2FG]